MFKKYILFSLSLALFVVPSLSFGATTTEVQAQIQAITEQIRVLQQQSTTLQTQQGVPTNKWCHTFNTNLRIGDKGDEVTNLILALQKETFIKEHDANFDEQVSSAVTGFQEKYRDEILTPNGLQYGTGYVGKSTRAKLNQLYGCEKPTPPPVTLGLKVLSPNGGEAWAIGSTQTIKWNSSNVNLVSLDLVSDSGVMFANLVNMTGNPGYATWTIPTYIPPGQYRVKVGACPTTSTGYCGTTLTTYDLSDAPFSIVAPTVVNIYPIINAIPAIPVDIKAGQTVSFSWHATDADNDDLSWSVDWGDGGGFAGPCSVSNPQHQQNWNFTASHAWTYAGTYTMKATVNDCRGGSDVNTVNVPVGSSYVQPIITVLSPNGGEVWNKATTQSIKWFAPQSDIPTYGDITLTNWVTPCDTKTQPCPAMSSILYTLAKNIPISAGSFSWKVGLDIGGHDIPAGQYVVGITDSTRGKSDQSNAPFSITAVPTINGSSVSTQQSATAIESMRAMLDRMQSMLNAIAR